MKNIFSIFTTVLTFSFCLISLDTFAQKTKASPNATIRIKNLSNCEITNITFWLATPYTDKGILYDSFELADDVVRANETFALTRKKHAAISHYTYTCYCEGQEGKFHRVDKYFSVRLGETKTITVKCD
ncbi:MAG: hypothetical protein NW218_00795 [Saprospiraceae bacterium]|nr:hypothetical protein [Saprospiraceae bacterium]